MPTSCSHPLADRLKIWMLPTLAIVKSGKATDYVVGFNELGGSDDFPTSALEARCACLPSSAHDRPRPPCGVFAGLQVPSWVHSRSATLSKSRYLTPSLLHASKHTDWQLRGRSQRMCITTRQRACSGKARNALSGGAGDNAPTRTRTRTLTDAVRRALLSGPPCLSVSLLSRLYVPSTCLTYPDAQYPVHLTP